MYPIVNPKPHFAPYDICKVVGTEYLVIVTEINMNSSQTHDCHQWSYSVVLIDKECGLKNAWYRSDELKRVNNIFEIIARKSIHPFGNKEYRFSLDSVRRDA